MTFKHKLSARLARLRAGLALAAGVMLACSDDPAGSLTSHNPPVYALTFAIGDRVKTSGSTNIRSGPSGSSSLVGTQPAGAVGTVVGGPLTDVSGDGLLRWQINFDVGADGWAAEPYAGLTLLAPATPVAAVIVTPGADTLTSGATVQLVAVAQDSAGNTLTGRTIAWSSGNTAVATVSASGVVTGVAAGAVAITATTGGKSGTAAITVAGVAAPAGKFTLGQRVKTSSNANIRSQPTASSSLLGKQSPGALGTVTAGPVKDVSGDGLTRWQVDFDAGVDGWALETYLTAVAPAAPVAAVLVSPATASIATGSTVQLAATTKDSAGVTLTGRTITWSSSNALVATVSAAGLVQGVAAGTATITATSEGKSASAAVTVTPTSGGGGTGTRVGYYVAPNGSSSGSGAIGSPWSLATALSGASGKVKPGDTIWVRGGTYTAPFRSTLRGTASARIVVRTYPGERAIIDGRNASGDNFVVAGSYSVFWGLEFTNSSGSRTTTVINHNFRPNMLVNSGPSNKYINLVLHDGGVAFFTYSAYADVEVYGSIVYNNGWQAPDRGHGHAMYLKSDVGPLTARDNVIFNQFGYGIHAYTNSGSGWLNGIRLEGNVSFNNGSLSTTGTSANIGNLGQPAANDLIVRDNMTYFAPSLSGTNLTLGSGSGLIATGNYVVGGSGITQGTWSGAAVSGNTVLSSATSSRSTQVFVRPNAYEAGRANIIVYNWGQQGSVSVPAPASLAIGARYEIRNVQDLFGAAVASGTFGGGSITVPIVGVQPPVPVGMSSSPAPATGTAFNVYVLTVLP